MRLQFTYTTLLILLTSACLGGAVPLRANGAETADRTDDRELGAVANLISCSDGAQLLGLAYLRERPSPEGVKEVDVMVRVWGGLPAGSHAVHIHETAACQPCSAAGGHFDPGPHSNTNPDGNHPFHSGDLRNIHLNDKGGGLLSMVTSRVSLSEGPLSLFDEDGSAFIIHVQPDSYCPDGVVAGCAGGARAACGVILPTR